MCRKTIVFSHWNALNLFLWECNKVLFNYIHFNFYLIKSKITREIEKDLKESKITQKHDDMRKYLLRFQKDLK